MRHGIRLLVITGIALLTWGTGAWADDALAGVDVVRARDVQAGTIQLGERVYHVTAETSIRRADGERIRLAALDVPDAAQDGLLPLRTVLVGRYRAARVGGRLVLRSLRLTPSPE